MPCVCQYMRTCVYTILTRLTKQKNIFKAETEFSCSRFLGGCESPFIEPLNMTLASFSKYDLQDVHHGSRTRGLQGT